MNRNEYLVGGHKCSKQVFKNYNMISDAFRKASAQRDKFERALHKAIQAFLPAENSFQPFPTCPADVSCSRRYGGNNKTSCVECWKNHFLKAVEE